MSSDRLQAVSEILGKLDRYSSEQRELHWGGTFADYLEKVVEKPQLVRLSHRYLFDAITSRPNFFETGDFALYGAEKATERLTEILEASAKGLEVRKRIILFMGPPGSGKTTIANALKRGLEEYSRTDEGATYAIADCPMNEEPMHLLPEGLRASFQDEYGVHVEGHLCPYCQEKYGEDPEKIQNALVKRLLFSEKERAGIGTFKPSDPKSQDLTELVGSVDFSKLAEYGAASDARAYRFDGELNVANRGVMEFVEMLKSDERFLYALLDLAQDKVIKAPRFPNIYADEVVVAHTNQTEYDKYFRNPANEALNDRTIVIAMPYNLKVSAEQKIYEKLIKSSEIGRESLGEDAVHISPSTLRVAAMFAVLSRLDESKDKGVKSIDKMKLYDGQRISGISEQEVKKLEEEYPDEGMKGISPRYVIDSLSTALISGNRKCLNPLDALRALRDGLDSHPHTRDLGVEDKDAVRDLITLAREEFDEIVKKEINSAFVHSFSDSAKTLFDNYLSNVEAFCNKEKVKDPITGDDIEPDERLMKAIEEQIGVSENAKREYRQELLNRVGALSRRGETVTYESHPKTKEAIEKKLFADLKDVVKLTTGTRTPDAEQTKRLEQVSDRLKEQHGYCSECADAIIKYVGSKI